MRNLPPGWKIIHAGHGRGDTSTRVEFADGRGINFSGRLTNLKAVSEASKMLDAWAKLDMVDAGLKAFDHSRSDAV